MHPLSFSLGQGSPTPTTRNRSWSTTTRGMAGRTASWSEEEAEEMHQSTFWGQLSRVMSWTITRRAMQGTEWTVYIFTSCLECNDIWPLLHIYRGKTLVSLMSLDKGSQDQDLFFWCDKDAMEQVGVSKFPLEMVLKARHGDCWVVFHGRWTGFDMISCSSTSQKKWNNSFQVLKSEF